jgi:hypothetical protein
VQPGDWLTLCGDLVAGIGLAFAWHGIHRGNQNASAASLIALNETLRQGWERYFAAHDGAKLHQFAELANTLEIACALCVKRVFVGVSRELLTEYLDEVMNLLNGSEDARQRLIDLLRSPTTFKYLRLYVGGRRKHIRWDS